MIDQQGKQCYPETVAATESEMHRRQLKHTKGIHIFLIVLCQAIVLSVAIAGDGVIEINQARAIAGGVTPTDTPGFPVTIDTSGSYVLTGPLTVPIGTQAYAIDVGGVGVEDVTLDLNGFALTGDMSGLPQCNVFRAQNVRSITLRKGAVRAPDTSKGIEIRNTGSATVEDLAIKAGRDLGGIWASDAGSVRISRNHIEGGGMIFVEGGTEAKMRGAIEGNVIVDAENAAIRVDAQWASIRVRNNVVDRAGTGGIQITLADALILEGNTVRNSGHTGISVSSARGCRLTDNVVTLAGGDGIYVEYGDGCMIGDNVSNHSVGTGLHLVESDSCHVVSNTLTHNGGAGFMVRGDGNVYARNMARGNAGNGLPFCMPAIGGLSPPDWCNRGGGSNDSLGDNMMPGPPPS